MPTAYLFFSYFHKFIFLALVLTSVFLAANASIDVSGIVTRVVDGDTIEVQDFGLVKDDTAATNADGSIPCLVQLGLNKPIFMR
jgi:endonuclease YncB( thermonuclease family)